MFTLENGMIWNTPCHRQLFDRARDAPNGDHIAHIDCVLELDEYPRDDVLDHRLGSKAYRQAKNTGGGEQRPDIQTDLGQAEHQGKDHQSDRRRVSQ